MLPLVLQHPKSQCKKQLNLYVYVSMCMYVYVYVAYVYLYVCTYLYVCVCIFVYLPESYWLTLIIDVIEYLLCSSFCIGNTYMNQTFLVL